eukprot:1410486-Amphidinium_carterae.1
MSNLQSLRCHLRRQSEGRSRVTCWAGHRGDWADRDIETMVTTSHRAMATIRSAEKTKEAAHPTWPSAFT